MAWKYMQYNGETGKRRTVSGGGGGASALTDLDDVNVSSPSDGQILKYDNASSKWVNANLSVGHTYSTTEQVVGTWIDGRPVYEKTIDFGYLPDTSGKGVAHNISNLDFVIQYGAITKNTTGTTRFPLPRPQPDPDYIMELYYDDSNVMVVTHRNFTPHYLYVVMQYVKTSDI